MDSVAEQQNGETLDSSTLHDLALELAGEWGLSENDMDMYFPPDQGSNQSPMMIVATANPTKERVVGVCQPVTGNWTDGNGVLHGSRGETVLDFVVPAQHYLEVYEHKNPLDVAITKVQIKLLAVTQAPKHGRLSMIENDPYLSALYRPDEGYFGKDRVEATVAVGKDIVRVVFNFVVQRKATDQLQPAEERKLCPNGFFQKISGVIDNGAGDSPAGMDALLTAATQNLAFADLNGSEVGQTLGNGANAQITLDTDAAGHGWYIDYTPYLNDEYLPTSNPLEWIAKPGSEAEGKMDMLTVLLHEYGHALGLEHSTDSHDLMAATLPPGVRRLPSAEELELLAQLVGVAKETGAASSVPYNPFSPPGTPLPMTMSVAAFVAARQRRSSLSSALTQFEIAANPTLTNPQFADSQGQSGTDHGFSDNRGQTTVSR